MASYKFEITFALDNSEYYYHLYEDGTEVEEGYAEYTYWDDEPEMQAAWIPAVNEYNKSHNISSPSDDLKNDLTELKETFNNSGDNLPKDQDTGLMTIPTALATKETDPEKFIDNLITACKKGPTFPKDLIFNRINVEKTNLINKGKNLASNYKNIMGVYLTPIEESMGDYVQSLDEYDAAQAAWRKKYAEEISSFEIVIAESNPEETSNSQTSSNPGTVLGADKSDYKETEDTDEDIFTTLGNMSYYTSVIPDDIQKQMDKVYKARFGEHGISASIKNRYNEYLGSYFKQYFSKYGTTIEMSLLSIIETNCNPATGSKENSCTALGIWQFTRPTGADYKLLTGYWEDGKNKGNNHNFKITSPYDYRTDIDKESEAAAKLLKNIHDKYVKNWVLTAAAYNWGPNNVQNTVKKYGSNLWTLLPHFPTETKNYCLLLIKLAQVFEYGVDFINS